jgi:hypothetical protein
VEAKKEMLKPPASDVINCVLIEADTVWDGNLFIQKFVLRCVFDRIVMDGVRER